MFRRQRELQGHGAAQLDRVDIETLEQIAVRVLMPSAAAVLAGIAASAFLAVFDLALGLVLATAMAVIGLRPARS